MRIVCSTCTAWPEVLIERAKVSLHVANDFLVAPRISVLRGFVFFLTRSLKDVAYGTRQYRVQEQPTTDGQLTNDLIEDAIELERGQNLIEIHISRASFNERALEYFGKSNEPSTFCSIEFFEHELQMTPIIKGRTPEYNFTAQYIVNVDDFLLYYLQKEYTLIELHQTVGQSFHTIAASKLSLKQLIEGKSKDQNTICYLLLFRQPRSITWYHEINCIKSE